MSYQTIEVTKLTPHIGAEIGGVDLSRPLGNQQFQEVHDALMENLVIFFRDQHLTHDQHKDFGRRFGKLAIHPVSRDRGSRNCHHPCRREFKARRRRGLAYRPVVHASPADGQHALSDRAPAGRRRYAVRQHVRGL
jgi:alpha-ketoglutarate-dependent taurine dioxygenase